MRKSYIITITTANFVVALIVLIAFSMLYTGDLFIVTPYAIANFVRRTGHLTLLDLDQEWYGHYNDYVQYYPLSGLVIGILSMVTDLDPWLVAWLPISALAIMILIIASIYRILNHSKSAILALIACSAPLTVLSLPLLYNTLIYHTLALTYFAYAVYFTILYILQPQTYRNMIILVQISSIASIMTHYRTTPMLIFFSLMMLIVYLMIRKRRSTIDVALLLTTILIIAIVQYFQGAFLANLIRSKVIDIRYILSPQWLVEELFIHRAPKEEFVRYVDYLAKNIVPKHPIALITMNLSSLIVDLVIDYLIPILLVTLMVYTFKNILGKHSFGKLCSEASALSPIVLGIGLTSLYVAGFVYFLVYGYVMIDAGYILAFYPLIIMVLKYFNSKALMKDLVIRILKVLTLMLALSFILYSVAMPFSFIAPIRSIWIGTFKEGYLNLGNFISTYAEPGTKIYSDFSLSFYITKIFYDYHAYEKELVVASLSRKAYILYENYHELRHILCIEKAFLALKEENFVYGVWGDVGKFYAPPPDRTILRIDNVVYGNGFSYIISVPEC